VTLDELCGENAGSRAAGAGGASPPGARIQGVLSRPLQEFADSGEWAARAREGQQVADLMVLCIITGAWGARQPGVCFRGLQHLTAAAPRSPATPPRAGLRALWRGRHGRQAGRFQGHPGPERRGSGRADPVSRAFGAVVPGDVLPGRLRKVCVCVVHGTRECVRSVPAGFAWRNGLRMRAYYTLLVREARAAPRGCTKLARGLAPTTSLPPSLFCCARPARPAGWPAGREPGWALPTATTATC
jgi:hypothetical protein